jgi:hypothetical protein
MTTLLLRRLASVALVLTLAGGTGMARAGNHVRVVLDTSLSMSRGAGGEPANDPKRLAVLATMLLYDLVNANPQSAEPQNQDSFTVLPFHPNWGAWTEPPPTGTGTPIRATAQDPSDRAAFFSRLQPDTLPYNARMTYFSPGLRAAIDSLGPAPATADDRRVIVLVTDGLPEREAQDKEKELLQGLRAEMLNAKIQFYVLAFGRIAHRERAFFDALFPEQNDSQQRFDPLGGVFVDANGQTLVLNMARIFSRSFGYIVDAPVPGGSTRPLNLDGGVTPPKVFVVALRREGAPPSQTITPQVTAPRGLLPGITDGAAYSVQAIDGVQPNLQYRLETDTAGADVAILRQVRPELGLLPGFVERPDGRQEMRQVSQVVAETPFVLRVHPRAPTGTAGGQPDLNISFRIRGVRTSGCNYKSTEEFGSIIQGSRDDDPALGAIYKIRMTFPKNQPDPGQVYRGSIEVWAKHNNLTVGRLECNSTQDNAHPVDVYPKIAIRTVPPAGFLSPSTLKKGRRGCVRFKLDMDDSEKPKLAVLGTPIRLRALVKPSDPGLAGGALAGATLTLDGEAVGYAGDTTSWHAGRELPQSVLLGEHEFCVAAGDPLITQSTEAFSVMLDLRLDHTPYDEFRVIEPFEAKLRVAPAHSLGDHFNWDSLWALLWPLLAALAALGLAAPRFALPEDLGYRLTAESESGSTDTDGGGGGAPLPTAATLQPLTPPTWWQRLLGLSPPRALRDPGSDRIIAWIKPLNETLYGLKPAAGIRVREPGGVTLDLERGVARIEVHHDYLLHGNAGRWRLRMGYAPIPAATTAGRPDAAAAPGPRHFSTQR